MVVDITAGERNRCFAEIEPCTVYPLYVTCLIDCYVNNLKNGRKVSSRA